MKSDHGITRGILFVLCAVWLTVPAFADSSWVWISETRPYDVLPWVAIATLIIETGIIWYVGRTGRLLKVFCVVTLGNLLSFAVPYLPVVMDPIHTKLHSALEHWPVYTVGFLYLVITILVELPIEYRLLRGDAGERQKPLLYAVIGSNVLTTVMVAVVERIFCRGHW